MLHDNYIDAAFNRIENVNDPNNMPPHLSWQLQDSSPSQNMLTSIIAEVLEILDDDEVLEILDEPVEFTNTVTARQW